MRVMEFPVRLAGSTEITRFQYERSGLRYASDLTDEEWKVIKPLLPPMKTLGRPGATDLHEALNAIFYMARTGCKWRMLPKAFLSRSRSSAISTLDVPAEHCAP